MSVWGGVQRGAGTASCSRLGRGCSATAALHDAAMLLVAAAPWCPPTCSHFLALNSLYLDLFGPPPPSLVGTASLSQRKWAPPTPSSHPARPSPATSGNWRWRRRSTRRRRRRGWRRRASSQRQVPGRAGQAHVAAGRQRWAGGWRRCDAHAELGEQAADPRCAPVHSSSCR